jgi:hypothetical protein
MEAIEVLIAITDAAARLHERQQAEQGKKPQEAEKEKHLRSIGENISTLSASAIAPS